MCEYCGCQAVTAIDELTREHIAGTETPADPGWPHQLVETLDVLRDHILKEQDGVFPAALTTLSGADWDSVDAVRSRAGSLLAADPPMAAR
jgi:hypothetical protein